MAVWIQTPNPYNQTRICGLVYVIHCHSTISDVIMTYKKSMCQETSYPFLLVIAESTSSIISHTVAHLVSVVYSSWEMLEQGIQRFLALSVLSSGVERLPPFHRANLRLRSTNRALSSLSSWSQTHPPKSNLIWDSLDAAALCPRNNQLLFHSLPPTKKKRGFIHLSSYLRPSYARSPGEYLSLRT